MKKINIQIVEFKLVEISIPESSDPEVLLDADSLFDRRINEVVFNGHIVKNFDATISKLKAEHHGLNVNALWTYACASPYSFIQTVLPALITLNSSLLLVPFYVTEVLRREVYENELMSPWSISDVDNAVLDLFPRDNDNLSNLVIFNFSIYRDLMQGGHLNEGLELGILKQWET